MLNGNSNSLSQGSICVTLHIYDLMDQTPLCCGFFHTGVVVNGVEWSFGAGGGICGSRPYHDTPEGCKFREAKVMGYVREGREIERALDTIRPEFPGDAYSLIFRNCNDFSNRFCETLLGKGIPGYINRLAWLGRQFPCRLCVPDSLKGNQESAREPLIATSTMSQGNQPWYKRILMPWTWFTRSEPEERPLEPLPRMTADELVEARELRLQAIMARSAKKKDEDGDDSTRASTNDDESSSCVSKINNML